MAYSGFDVANIYINPNSASVTFKVDQEEVEQTIEPVVAIQPKAQTKPALAPITGLAADCEQYRSLVSSYFGEYTDQALFISTKEASCQNIKSKKANPNGTYDYCIFQINKEPSALDINTCVRRAWEKFKASGYVWQQWYAVCPIDKKTGKQYQKFATIPCFKQR